jgi:hypothetical protein
MDQFSEFQSHKIINGIIQIKKREKKVIKHEKTTYVLIKAFSKIK